MSLIQSNFLEERDSRQLTRNQRIVVQVDPMSPVCSKVDRKCLCSKARIYFYKYIIKAIVTFLSITQVFLRHL